MTNRYAKYISETQIEFPPVNKDNIINYYLDVEELTKDGYKELEECPIPETDRYFEIRYRDEDKIRQYIVWLETKAEYDARKLQEAKKVKKAESDEKRSQIRAIKAQFSATESGYLLRATPVGDIMTVVMGIALPAMMAQQPIPAGSMRYYNAEGQSFPIPQIEAAFVPTFYQLFVQSIATVDTYSANIDRQISEATTIEEVEAIVIDYNTVIQNS